MLNIPNLKIDPEEVEHPFKFPLDPFQKHALLAISKDENVLVTAKTGSGKTLVGEYQIYHSLKKGKRVFYTTPIKSLSNQKFHDLKKMYPSVGIMTGDIKFCPQADIVIMTTEILRNLLFRKGKEIGVPLELSLDNLDAVVFDEVHYINDHDRGKVWEECLTMLPREVNLVLLSATIDQPEHFARWLGEIKQKPIHLISTQYRIVPLVHTLPNKEIVMDSKDVYHPKVYEDWHRNYYRTLDEERKHKERVLVRDSDQVVKREAHTTSFLDRMNKLISTMELPALFFVFSRNLCSEYAKKVNQDLLTSTETAEVKHIVKFHLKDHPEINKISQYNELMPLLEKGVAFHHSGLLPVLKEIIEILFSKGFIKVLFATETFAVGINMPTKTVVFTSYRKYTDGEYRMLTTSEYIQMAGRAGRRGKDDKGIVIYLPNKEPEEPLDVKNMMTGKTVSVNSQMDFGYDYILSTMFYGKDFQDETYWMTQRKQENEKLKDEIELKKQKCPKFEEFILHDLEKRDELETEIQKFGNAKKRTLQSQLEQWKNKHSSRMWDELWKEYKKSKKVREEIEQLENVLKYNSYKWEIDGRKILLEKFGYIEGSNLTDKGMLASQIHEGHPLIMSEMFMNEWIHHAEVEQIVCSLSMFLENPDKENNHNEKHVRARYYASELQDAEQYQSSLEYWDINAYWYEPVYDWITGDDFVCEKYGIEHGNFVKAMLKLSNIVDEWVNMATIMQDVEMIEKCKDIKNKIVRGFVIPDSLYLRI